MGTTTRLRCFVAASISSAVIRRLQREIGFFQMAGADVKWVPAGNMHITLRFVGEVASQEVMGVVDAIRQATETRRICRPMIRGIFTLPPNKSPRVVVAGVADDIDPLRDVFNGLQRGLAELGFRPEGRGYAPHVTLGRVRATRDLTDLERRIEESADRRFGLTTIDHVSLFLSEMEANGPTYTVMEEFPLELVDGDEIEDDDEIDDDEAGGA